MWYGHGKITRGRSHIEILCLKPKTTTTTTNPPPKKKKNPNKNNNNPTQLADMGGRCHREHTPISMVKVGLILIRILQFLQYAYTQMTTRQANAPVAHHF